MRMRIDELIRGDRMHLTGENGEPGIGVFWSLRNGVALVKCPDGKFIRFPVPEGLPYVDIVDAIQ